jgi:alpha-beta hydrolase superfamily lysophospholipase
MKKINTMAKKNILLFLCFVFVGCTIAVLEVYSSSFGRVDELSNNEVASTWYFIWSDIDQIKYSRKEVRFNSGRNKLQGFIYGGANNNGLVIISHGLGGTADAYFPMIMYFVDNGWRVFAYNNTGVSGSEGESTRGLIQSVIDLEAALTYVKNSNELDNLPIMLVGHSWGGFAVCAVLNKNNNINAVVSFAGYNTGSEVLKEFTVSAVGGIYYMLSPQFWAIEKELFGDMAKLTAIDGINKTSIPVMIVQCSNDDVITPNGSSIFAHHSKITNPNVEIIYREGENATGHEYTFSSKEQKIYIDWAKASWEAYKAGHKNASITQWAKEVNYDKAKANELDPDLMEEINIFFNNVK